MHCTFAIVRSRALDRGLRRDTRAVLVGGTTTLAPRAPVAFYDAAERFPPEDRARRGGRRNVRRTPARIDFTPEMLAQDMVRRLQARAIGYPNRADEVLGRDKTRTAWLMMSGGKRCLT